MRNFTLLNKRPISPHITHISLFCVFPPDHSRDTQIDCVVAEGLEYLGRKDEAINLLEDHLKAKPWDVHCLCQIGLMYEDSGEYKKALGCFEKSLESIKGYSELFRKNFSKLILESREQVLKKIDRG